MGRKLLAIAYVLMLGTNLLVYIFLPQLSGLYGLTAETTAVVHDLLLWHCIFASLFYPAGSASLRRCALPEMCATPWSSAWRRCWSFASG